jgi:hypothetical protein
MRHLPNNLPFAKHFNQFSPRPMNPGFDGSQGAVERGANFGVTKFLLVKQ